MLFYPVGQPPCRSAQLLARGRREREQQRPGCGAGGLVGSGSFGRLLEHGVHVCSGHPERGHRSTARLVGGGRPGRDFFRNQQAGFDLAEFVGQPGEMCHRGHQPGTQTEDGLDEPDSAGRRLGMAEIAFRRTDYASVSVGAVHLRQTTELQRVTDRCAGAVRLDHADGGRVHPCHPQGRAVDVGLGIQRWCRDRHRAAVLICGGSPDHGKDPVAVTQCVRQPLEQHHRAAIGTHEAVSADVEGMTTTGRGQHALGRCRCADGRLENHLATAGQGVIALAVVQAPTGQVHRKQTRRTRAVDGERRSAQPQGVGDAARRHAVRSAGVAVRTRHGARFTGHQGVVVMTQSGEDPGRRIRQCRRRHPGVFHRFPGGLHHQTVLWVDRLRFPVPDAEEPGIEAGDVVDEPTPSGHRPARNARLGVVVFIELPAVRGDLSDQVIAAQQGIPQQFGGVDSAGQPAGHADHRNRCDLGSSHKRSFAFEDVARSRAAPT